MHTKRPRFQCIMHSLRWTPLIKSLPDSTRTISPPSTHILLAVRREEGLNNSRGRGIERIGDISPRVSRISSEYSYLHTPYSRAIPLRLINLNPNLLSRDKGNNRITSYFSHLTSLGLMDYSKLIGES